MLYSDGIHIISIISLDHLHKEMTKIGIKRCWLHNSKFKHYDIPKKKINDFFQDNLKIKKVSSKELVKIYNLHN